MTKHLLFAGLLAAAAGVSEASAASLIIDTGPTDGAMAMASRPASSGKNEIETADDFALTGTTALTHASFTGLIVPSSAAIPTIQQVVVEIYRVFPFDSDVGRTSGPPTFATPRVPTRVNSPSDVAFDSRDSAANTLLFSSTVLSTSFTTLNSVAPGSIHFIPNQQTGGTGSLVGTEVQFDVDFPDLVLPDGHYFFVPQVAVLDGEFYWLSGQRPLASLTPDLQAWTRDSILDPDWLRVGTDIVGAPSSFNGTFSLEGTAVTPLPAAATTGSAGLLLCAGIQWLRRRMRAEA